MKALNVFSLTLCFLSLAVPGSLTFAQDKTADLKAAVYSQLRCCSCKEDFTSCRCKEAKEMKAYIDGLLDSGLTQEEILYKVAKKFSLNTIADPQSKKSLEQCFLKEGGGSYARAVFEPAELEFGQVSRELGQVSKKVKIYNRGNADLVINDLRVSCHCVKVALITGKGAGDYFSTQGVPAGWETAVAPGKYAELEVVLDLKDKSMTSGKQFRTVFISSNDPVNKRGDLTVKVEVKE